MMLAWKLAIRFLKSGRLQTVLITIGISIAIAVQVFIGLLIGSLQKNFVDRTLGSSADVVIESAVPGNPVIENSSAIITVIEKADGIDSFSLVADGNAFAENEVAVYMKGFDLSQIDAVYNVADSILEGSMPQAYGEVIIGRELSELLRVIPADTFSITLPGGNTVELTIAGIYDLGVAQINETWVFADIETVQNVFDYGDRVTGVEVSTRDVFEADSIAQMISEELDNPDITVTNWIDENEELFQALRSQDISTYMIQTAVIASVVVAIASMLAITVLQKSRQIGILKAMGIKDREASLVFLFQGFTLGLVGSIVGVSIGVGMLFAFTIFVTDESGSSLISFYLDWGFILISWIIAIIASTLAGVLPARRSARLSPIEVINAG